MLKEKQPISKLVPVNLLFSLFTRKHVNQIPIHGDAFFMPDWTRKKGIDIIKGRKAQWEALMLIFVNKLASLGRTKPQALNK